MVTGSSLCLQGIAEAHLGVRLDPIALRALLHDTGVPHLDPNKQIGPRPDLGAASYFILSSSAVAELGGHGSDLKLSIAPNPTSASAAIRFVAPGAAVARLALFDATGRCVRELAPRRGTDGAFSLTWDGRDASGRQLPSGVYFLRARQGQTEAVREVLLAR